MAEILALMIALTSVLSGCTLLVVWIATGPHSARHRRASRAFLRPEPLCRACGMPLPSPYLRRCPRCRHHTLYGRLVRPPRRIPWEFPVLAVLVTVLVLLLLALIPAPASPDIHSPEDFKQYINDTKDYLNEYLQWFRATGVYWLGAILIVGALVYLAFRSLRDR